MQINEKLKKIRFDGGSLALNFVNTVHGRTEPILRDYLLSPVDVPFWASRAQVISGAEKKAITEWVSVSRAASVDQFAQVLELREVLFSIFSSIALKKKCPVTNIELFNQYLSQYLPFLHIRHVGGMFREYWNISEEGFGLILAPVVKDSYELLVRGRLDRIGQCANCGWLFLDTSKNGRRKWCSMQTCGSNVKALEYYYRNKENSES